MKKKHLIVSLLSLAVIAAGCGSKKGGDAHQQQTINELNASKKVNQEIEDLNNEYRDIPDAKLLDNDGANGPVYAELKERYKKQLGQLKSEVEATGAKFIVVMITPEVGPGITNLTRYGHPYIKATCQELGIEVYDLSPAIAAQNPDVITQAPRDGHWSRKGSVFLADQLEPIIKKCAGYKSTKKYTDAERSETFGDLNPGMEEVLDGGKNIPYVVKANAQGLRMDHDIHFPKTKQHILFLGGSQIYSPFLDNEFIATSLLAKRFPDVEMLNAGMISGCTDDFLSLWQEKAKYCEPDVVIMQTNGTDITDLYFTNRNHLSRAHRAYHPSPAEEKYFNEHYKR